MSTVKIPPVLRASVGGAKEVEASGSDVGAEDLVLGLGVGVDE